MSRYTIFFLFIIALFSTILYSVYQGWYSYLILWLGLYIAGNQYLKFRHSADKNHLILVFTFAYSVYSVYMYATNFIYVDNPSTDFFMMVDSMKFWDNSDFRMNSFEDVAKRIDQMSFITSRYRLFNIQSISLAYYSQVVDENNILVQKLPSVFLGAFSMPFLYLMLKKYLTDTRAFNFTLFFSFFSFVCIYSVVFNRDPQVYFLYTIGAYLIVYYKEKKNIPLKLFVLMLLTMGFRFEHGLFFLLYILLYFYLINDKKLEGKFLLTTFLIVSSIFLIPFLTNKFSDTSEAYENQRQNTERKEISIGAKFASLPFGIKQTLLLINGQVAPAVPFWRGWFSENFNSYNLKFSQPGYFTPWRFMESVAAITWIFIWAFILTGIKRYFSLFPIELKGLFFFALLLLLATTSSIDVRRMYCVYPIIFIISMFIYNRMDSEIIKKIISRTSAILCLIYIMYFIIK